MKKPTKSIVFGVTVTQSIPHLGKLPLKLAAAGWEVYVVSSSGPETSVFGNSSVKVVTIEMSREPAPLQDLVSLWKWWSFMRSIKPMVVSVGSPKAALFGILASYLLRIPHRFYILRGLRLETKTGFSRIFLASFELLCSRLATQVLAVSHSLARVYVAQGLADKSKVKVVGHGSSHGVDLSRFRPASDGTLLWKLRDSAGIKLESPVIGYVGRIARDKGLLDLAEAIRIVSEKFASLQLLLVGPEEGLEIHFTSLLPSNVHTVQISNSRAVEEFYPIMSFLVLPTYREGFPNVVLEAAATGIPTITTDVTGAVDSVVHNKTGLIVTPRDARSLALAIESLLLDPVRTKILGKNARLRAEEFFDEEVVERELREQYEQAAKEALAQARVPTNHRN